MAVIVSSPWYPAREWTGKWEDDRPLYTDVVEYHLNYAGCRRIGYVEWNSGIRGSTLERIDPLIETLRRDGGVVCPACLFAASLLGPRPARDRPWGRTFHVEI
jgi:hypothetical protein